MAKIACYGISVRISLLITAFCVFARPILENNPVVWSPMLQQEIYKIECVQRRFTKKLHGLHKMTYRGLVIDLFCLALRVCIVGVLKLIY